MKFMLRVEAQDVSADYAVLSAPGPGAVPAGWPRPCGSDTLDSSTDLIVPAGGLAARGRRAARGRGGTRRDVGARGAAHRGRPAPVRPRHRPPDDPARGRLDRDRRCTSARAATAVRRRSPGCTTSGHPPRRLVLLHLDGSEDRLPAHGDLVLLDGAEVGFTGSAARHYELGPIGAGPGQADDPGRRHASGDGVPAAQEVIVSPDAGANIQIKLKRARGDLIGRGRE